MIEIRFEERVKIGLQYVLESLHGCSPFGQERSAACGSIRRRSGPSWRRSCITWSGPRLRRRS